MNVDLNGKVVVITGSSRGIGRKLAISFAQEGAHVAINYNRSKQAALDLYDQISMNSDCMVYPMDVTNVEQVKIFIQEVIRHYGRIDVLVNNAGINCDHNVLEMSDQQWEDVIQTNLNGVFYSSRECLQYMVKRKSGRIINIGSYIGLKGRKQQSNYSASKAALLGLTRSIAKDVAEYNISVNLVCPGFILTDFTNIYPYKEQIAKEESIMPIDSLYDDLEKMLFLLSSDAIKGVSGQVFHLDSRI